jgi:hypothetical protein
MEAGDAVAAFEGAPEAFVVGESMFIAIFIFTKAAD